MLTSMEVSPDLPGAPDLPIGGFVPNANPIQIRNIDGLGPPKADIQSTPFATARGEFFQGSSTETRNIVLTLGLNPNWLDQTMSNLRQLLYRYFMTESFARYRFFSDEMETVEALGMVESFEPNIFSDDPEIQISVICDRPDFVAVDDTTITGTTSPDPVTVTYVGTVNAGFTLHIDGSGGYTGDIEVSNNVGPLSQDFLVNDVTLNSSNNFELNSLHGQRHVHRLSSDGDTNLLQKTTKSSTWPEFSPGDNSLVVRLFGGPGLDWTLTYNNRYGGL